MSNKNAHIGTNVEYLFSNSIKYQKDVLDILKKTFGITNEIAQTYKTGVSLGKADVIIKFLDGKILSANIKAYKSGFNQLTRITIKAFCDQFGLSHSQKIFEDGAIRVAKKTGKFILEENQKNIGDSIAKNAKKIIQFSLARLEKPELLVLFDRENNLMNLYDLNEVFSNLDYKVSFSSRGIIKIGKYITIQRKGGNGVHSQDIPKISLKHPGNNLQVKMKVKKFVLENKQLAQYKP
jgi:hypothetical protein